MLVHSVLFRNCLVSVPCARISEYIWLHSLGLYVREWEFNHSWISVLRMLCRMYQVHGIPVMLKLPWSIWESHQFFSVSHSSEGVHELSFSYLFFLLLQFNSEKWWRGQKPNKRNKVRKFKWKGRTVSILPHHFLFDPTQITFTCNSISWSYSLYMRSGSMGNSVLLPEVKLLWSMVPEEMLFPDWMISVLFQGVSDLYFPRFVCMCKVCIGETQEKCQTPFCSWWRADDGGYWGEPSWVLHELIQFSFLSSLVFSVWQPGQMLSTLSVFPSWFTTWLSAIVSCFLR